MMLYRYDNVTYAPMADECGERRGRGHVAVELHEYEVVKRTPKGFWVRLSFGDRGGFVGGKRFVLADAHRKFACETKAAALESFIARKTKQIKIYEARIATAREAMRLAKDLRDGINISF